MAKATRYYIKFICSNGRVRYCGQGTHMPYLANAAELYVNPDKAWRRADMIPATHLMRGTKPELMTRQTVVVAHMPRPPSPAARQIDVLPGLRTHAL